MTPETIKAIQDALTPIAAKIGQGAAFGWDIVVQQQKVLAITDLVWVLPLGIIAGVFWWIAFRYVEKTDGVSLFATIPALLFTVWMFSDIDEAITHLLNPSYYALQFFMGLVK